jgi:hypothetical protein
MKTHSILLLALAAAPAALFADQQPPVPITEADSRPQPAPIDRGEPDGSGQKTYGQGTVLIGPDKARQVVDAFRAASTKDGAKAPRYLIYVNRELVDETSGLRMTGRKERTESTVGETKSVFEADPYAPRTATPAGGAAQINVTIGDTTTGQSPGAGVPGAGSAQGRSTKVTADNTYDFRDKANPSLVDRQTVRDIERLFGRPLRAGGAKLADQKTAAALIADKPLDHFTTVTNEAAAKDREALAKIADVVVEILVSTRTLTLPGISGDTTQSVPDIQATAIRLGDAAIIGQASASDVLGKDKVAGRLARKFDVSDIAEATALALMEDITLANP